MSTKGKLKKPQLNTKNQGDILNGKTYMAELPPVIEHNSLEVNVSLTRL